MFREKSIVAFSVTSLLLISCAAGTAIAQRQSTPRAPNKVALGERDVKQLLVLMDKDKNGRISRQEYMNFMQGEFDRLDKDKSGELDAKELRQSGLRPSDSTAENYVKQLLLLMDTDKNGKISKDEYMKFAQEEFDRLDEDKSGELDMTELTQSRLRPSTFSSVGK
jgi:Ca2+-binding EF-hand superfamily protein